MKVIAPKKMTYSKKSLSEERRLQPAIMEFCDIIEYKRSCPHTNVLHSLLIQTRREANLPMNAGGYHMTTHLVLVHTKSALCLVEHTLASATVDVVVLGAAGLVAE